MSGLRALVTRSDHRPRSAPAVMSLLREEQSALLEVCRATDAEAALEAEEDARWLSGCRVTGAPPGASCERLLEELHLYRPAAASRNDVL
ncbi:hypothetical protein [Methylobacterium oryzisoli]|uniref:hypothetical protein n=1 Tax=Methylobacterium oryzisoli TaxID=3385502 RepID=UPI0038928B37